MITFGVNLSYARMHPSAGSGGLYDEMLELAVAADNAGFEAIWVAEHHMLFVLQVPNALLALAHMAPHVGCRLGTAALVLPYRHPLITAGEIAEADHITGGRLEVGVCRGAYELEFERLGVDYAKGKQTFRESVEVLEQCLGGDGPQGYDGEVISYRPTITWPRPLQQPRPPIWVAAMSEESIQWAVARGLNVQLVQFFEDIDHVCRQVECFHRAREAAGLSRDDVKVACLQPTYVSESMDDVRARTEEMIHRHRVHHLSMTHDAKMNELSGNLVPEALPGEKSVDEVIANGLIGTPADVIAKIDRVQAAGLDHIQAHVAWGISTADALRSIRLIGDAIIPRYAPVGAGA